MPQFPRDAWSMLTRVIHPHMPIVVLDVGANVGSVARRIREVFRDSTVHAFEPAPDVYQELCARCAGDFNIVPVRSAVADRQGSIPFHLTADRVLSSALPPTEHGSRAYGPLVALDRTVDVPCTTLDAWARSAGVTDVHALKVDVQGLELAVLRGADELLRSTVMAVNTEAQLIPEYQGAGTFSEIDLFLRERGFLLHQVHELWHQGREFQSSCVDALWLRAEMLEWLRADPDHAYRVGWADLVRRGLSRCRQAGRARVALYGAGEHTREALARLDPAELPACILDDNPARAGESIRGVPIVPADQAPRHADAVVISSHFYDRQLWTKAAPWRTQGLHVERLYGKAA